MKKILAAAVVMGALIMATPAFAATPVCGDPGVSCDNGNPEMVVSAWGRNADVPHLKPGTSVINQWGEVVYCPAFISTYCVDISASAYYINWHKLSFGN